MTEDGVSPVVGIILLTAVTVVMVSLAAFFVFDVGQSSSSSIGTATVDAEYVSESRIEVQLVKQSSTEKVIVRSSLGTEYVLNETGQTAVLLNQDGNKTPVVLGEKDGERSVLRSVPPRSFTPDIVVANSSGEGQYDSVQTALNNAQDGDIVVLKKDVYYENIDIAIDNITIVGETGTVIADNTSDDTVIQVQSNGVRISNIDVNATSTAGGNAAEYGISAGDTIELSQVRAVNANTSNVQGTVEQVDDSAFVSQQSLVGTESTAPNRILPTTPRSVWVNIHNSTNGDDRGQSVAIDSDRDVIVVGYSYNGADKDWRVVKYDSDGTKIWTHAYDSGGKDIAYGVGLDSNDNIIVTGTYDSGSDDWRTVKYNDSGAKQWVNTYSSGNGNDRATAVAVDSNGNSIVVGFNDNGVDLDWRAVKYNSTGVQKWTQSYDSGGNDYLYGVGVDTKDNVIVTGHNSNDNVRTVKYNEGGSEQWVTVFDESSDDRGSGVVVDKQDNVIVAGHKYNSSSSGYEWYVVKYNSTGAKQWLRTYDKSAGNDIVHDVAVDDENNVVVAGESEGSSSFNWLLVKYDSGGSQIWKQTYDGGGTDRLLDTGVGSDAVFGVGFTEENAVDNWRVTKYSE